jgi:hypothetical protein
VGFIPSMQRWFNIHKTINTMHHVNRMNGQKSDNHIINAEKALERIQHLLVIRIWIN